MPPPPLPPQADPPEPKPPASPRAWLTGLGWLLLVAAGLLWINWPLGEMTPEQLSARFVGETLSSVARTLGKPDAYWPGGSGFPESMAYLGRIAAPGGRKYRRVAFIASGGVVASVRAELPELPGER